MMWRQTFCLILSVIFTGSLSVSWDMTVSPVVYVPRGEDAVLSCSFTHPRQQSYSGKITVKWLARESNAPPFLICSIKNESTAELCSISELKHSVVGDPRRGELSLLIRSVHLGDNGTYFCRVELDSWIAKIQKETQLYVTVEPKILSLSVVEASPGSDSAPRRLRCEAEGHPLPTITWLSASRSFMKDQIQTSKVGLMRLVSWVPYLEEDVFTCRVESRVGGAERRYPAVNTLMIAALTVCGLIVLLLLSAGFILRRRNTARADMSPVYENADAVENHRLQDSDPPAEGDGELQLVYSAVSLTHSTSSQHESCQSSSRQQEPSGVLYSPVNIQ
ncbi:sialic acid-binding Ig-like lectin 15 isoform X1 [Plectropomus leopardus]|uniref:sialic acid-binding Ig-like lectin 15 isoform X1 n=1 Tax=Plectropomus leopardus TaxID=160734 RepID=UPI001C4AC032|nr:sialic acid-binding Ig-like lectin 15 isoform X1 [Plectropomus leopardus]XP_042346243.1 sialic acid-binding Ig-like lectin 15 isoform X1 [Plectropomus leopardus]